MEILRIRDQHAKEKSNLLSSNVVPLNASPNNPKSRDRFTVGGDANPKMLEQMEQLRQELRKNQELFSDERRSLQIDFNNQLLSQERKFKSDIHELKNINHLLEEKLMSKIEELQSMEIEMGRLRLSNQQAIESKQLAVQEQVKLRQDLKNIQQSIQANYRFDNSTTKSLSPDKSVNPSNDFGQSIVSNLPNDVESMMKINDAKYEAKLRQLTNKLDFLKSQLETERRELEETKQLLTTQQQEAERMKILYDKKIATIHQDHERKLLENEERVALNYEKRMIELTNLQKQFQSLTNQTNELKQQNNESLMKEEYLQQQNNKLQVNLLNYQKENDNLKRTIESLEDIKSRELLKENEKLSQDATIKRLDNERNYLKNQLKSEITLKAELQGMLDESNRLLRDTQNQWSKDVEHLKEERNSILKEFQEKENALKLSIQQGENDLAILKSQNSDLKLGFQKCRESLKMEQLSLENLNSEKDRLLKEVQSLTKDLAYARENEKLLHSSTQQQLQAMESLIQDNLDKYTREKKLLKEELLSSLEKNSQLNQEIIELKSLDSFQDNKLKRKIALARAISLTHLATKKLHASKAFMKWFFNISLLKIVNQFKQQMEKLLKKTKEDAEKEKQEEIVKLKNELKLEKINELAKQFQEQQTVKEKEKEILAEEYERKMVELKELHLSSIREMEADHQFDLEKMSLDFTQQKAIILETFEKEKGRLNELKEKELNKLKSYFEGVYIPDYRSRLLEEFNSEKTRELNSKDEEHAAKCHKLQANYEIEIDFKLNEQSKLFQQSLDRTKENFQEEKKLLLQNHDFIVDKQKKEFQSLVQDLHDKALRDKEEAISLALSNQRKEMNENYEQQLQELKTLWKEEQNQLLSTEKELLSKEFEEKISKLLSNFETEKNNVVKQEMKKWKLILTENEKSKELEIQKIINQTQQEMKSSFEKEKVSIFQMIELEKIKERDFFQLKLQEREMAFDKEKAEFVEKQNEKLENQKRDFEKLCEKNLFEKFNLEFQELLLKKTEEFNHLLLLEQKRLESLKEDFSKQTKSFAKERDSLLKQISNFDAQLKLSEENQAQLLENLKNDFLKEKDDLFEQHQTELEAVKAQHAKDVKEKLESASIEWNSMYHRKLKDEKEELLKSFESQSFLVQQENEKLIKQFESSLNLLQNEKENLKTEFNKLTAQLQEMEDSFYDSQQLLKSEKKEHSLHLWQLNTKLLLMKLKFQKGIQEFDAEAQKRFENMKLLSLQQYQDLGLQFMKACSFVHELDEKRNVLLSLMNNYNDNEEMRKNKKNIQIIEHEIDKLFSEKDSLESNKEILLKEIDSLTLEIKENEDLARKHSQESAMTINGRVNLAFARKKRRLDNEIERLLELMENKRNQITEIDDKILEKVKVREEKELLLISMEQKFISMIIQQQKDIYKELMEWGIYSEKLKVICQIIRFPFPPRKASPAANSNPQQKQSPSKKKQKDISESQNPEVNAELSLKDVIQLMEQWKIEDERKDMNNPHKP